MISLIIGGSGSGKSEFAENRVLCLGEQERIYIATMYPFDGESKKRIERHQKMRENKKFRTIECYTNLEQAAMPANAVVLLECMSNLIANEMYQEGGAGKDTVEQVMKGIEKIAGTAKSLIIVSNEVCTDGIVYDETTMTYIANIGEINRRIGKIADEIVEVVYSIPIYHKKILGKRLKEK